MPKPYIFAGYTVASGLPSITESQAKRLTHLNVAFGIVKDKRISVEAIEYYFLFIPRLRAYNPDLNIFAFNRRRKPDRSRRGNRRS